MASDFARIAQTSGGAPTSARLWAWTGWFDRVCADNRDRLILFAPVALGAGIALWFALPWANWRLAALLAALAIGLAGCATVGGARRAAVVGGLLVALGLVAAEYRAASIAPPLLHHRLTAYPVSGTIVERQPRQGGEATRLVVARPATGTDPAHRVRITFTSNLPGDYRPGAIILVSATLGPFPGPVLPGGYDGVRRAWFDGISATGRATGAPILLKPAERPAVQQWLDGVRIDLSTLLIRHLPADRGGIAIALLVGDQGHISDPLLESMRVAGLAHLLTVSGFHVAVVVGGMLFLARRLVTLWPWAALRMSARSIAAVVAGVSGVGYAMLSGAEVPAVRAAIMALILLAAVVAGRNPLSLRLLGFAAMLILLVRPEVLLSPSFQLSFAAVGGLLLLSESTAGQWMKRQPDDGYLQRAGRWILALLLSGIVAELVLTPIALAHFGRSGSYGVLANLAAIPLTGMVIIPLLGLFLLLAPFGLAGLLSVPLGWALGLLAGIGATVATWPGATVAVPSIPSAAFAVTVSGALLLGLLRGWLRIVGLGLLLAGVTLALVAPPPALIVPASGRQVAYLSGGELHALTPHRRGFQWRQWEEASRANEGVPIPALPSAHCDPVGCRILVDGVQMLLGFGPAPSAAACAAVDMVVLPSLAPADCRPRWHLLDAESRQRAGATLVWPGKRRMRSQADVAGDHPWSPSVLPGTRINLLGQAIWTGVIAE